MFNVKWGVFAGGAAFVLALIFSLLFGKVLFLVALLRALIFAVVFFALGTGIWILISSFLPDLLLSGGGDAPGGDMTDIFTPRETPGSRVDITVGGASGVALPDASGGMLGVDEVGDISDLISGKIKPAAMPANDMDQMRPGGYTGNAGGRGAAGGLADAFSSSDSGSGGFSPDFSDFTGGGDTGAPSPSNGMADGDGDDGGVFGDFGDFSGDDSAGGDGAEGGSHAGGHTPVTADLGGFTGKAGSMDGLFDDDDIFSSAGIYSSGGEDPFADAGDSDHTERKSSKNKAQEFDGDFNPKEIAAGLRTVLDRDKKG